VGVDSHVTGGIKYTKPNGISFRQQRDPVVIIGPNARVDGPLVFERPVKLYVHASAKTGAIRGATAVAGDASDDAPYRDTRYLPVTATLRFDGDGLD
ncbi:hypothetical protein HKX41_11105, partial [Salinisphaera sp. USBA-960]|nr:hypothetical protein [Salifodinibacter halophilus]